MDEARPPAQNGVIPRLAELMAEYHARQEAVWKEAAEVSKLGEDVRGLTDGEAARIVAASRESIRRVLQAAHRDLQELRVRVTKIVDLTQPEPASSRQKSAKSPPPRQAAARHDTFAERAAELFPPRPGTEPKLAAKTVVSRPRAESSPKFEPFRALDQTGSTSRRPFVGLAVAGVLGLGALAALGVNWLKAPSAAPLAESSHSSPGSGVVEQPRATATTLRENKADTPPAIPSSRASAEVWVRAEARRPVWVKTSVDGGAPENRLFQAGETRRFMATQNVSMTAADAGALVVSVNGGPSAAMGRPGQTITREFKTQPSNEGTGSPANARESQNASSAMPQSRPDSLADSPTTTAEARTEIEALNRRWFDGYQRRDNNTMTFVALPDVSVSDERAAAQRPPLDLTNVRRTFDRIQFDRRGDTAVFAAKMVEDCDIGDTVIRHVSLISESWRRADNRWRLSTVRIIHETE